MKIIDTYLEKKEIEVKQTNTGIRYYIINEGSGEYPMKGDKIKVNYTGRVLEGGYFDTSIKEKAEELGIYDPGREPYQPFIFTLGQGEVIYGWDDALQHINEGSTARIFIPSPMAYGESSINETITANSILVFDVELIEILN